jgi:protein YibB
MEEITIVTAFFDINRNNWKTFNRSADKYISYFKFWARIKNKLIIYTSEDLKDEILCIRKEYGLENQTILHVVDDYRKIDPDMYLDICKSMAHADTYDFRLLKHVPESYNADYNYLTGLKAWFMKDAVSRNEATSMIAWMDFGYNHGGEVIKYSKDFDFNWKYNFSKKIHLFLIRDIPKKPLFTTIRNSNTSVMGALIVAPDYLCETLWDINKKVIDALNICGFADDDQTILQGSFMLKSELFELHYTDWHKPIVVCGGNHMNLVDKKELTIVKKNILNIYLSLKKLRENVIYAVLTFKSLNK